MSQFTANPTPSAGVLTGNPTPSSFGQPTTHTFQPTPTFFNSITYQPTPSNFIVPTPTRSPTMVRMCTSTELNVCCTYFLSFFFFFETFY